MAGLPSLLVVRTTTSAAINDSADTAVIFTAATRNTGPASWWSAVTPTNIVMPYAGPYFVSLHLTWDTVVDVVTPSNPSRKALHFANNNSIGSGDFQTGAGVDSLFATTASAYCQVAEIINVTTPGDIWQLVAWHNDADDSGTRTRTLTTRTGEVYAAMVGLVYLGDV